MFFSWQNFRRSGLICSDRRRITGQFSKSRMQLFNGAINGHFCADVPIRNCSVHWGLGHHCKYILLIIYYSDWRNYTVNVVHLEETHNEKKLVNNNSGQQQQNKRRKPRLFCQRQLFCWGECHVSHRDLVFIIIIIIIQEKIYVAFSPSELQGHVTMSKS